MNVLFLSYDGMTDSLGQSQVLPYLTGLSKKGINVFLISFEKPIRFEKYKSTIEEITQKNNIKWFPLNYTKSPPIISTIYDLVLLYFKAASIIKKYDIKLLHSRTLLTCVSALQLKKKFNVKLLFDMRSFFADERVDGKLWNRKNLVYNSIYKFFKRKERQAFIEADHLISLTFAAKNEILTWGLPISEDKITVIPCCADEQLFDPKKFNLSDRKNVRDELKIVDSTILFIYIGGLGTWYCLDEMLHFFKNAKMKFPDSKFLILTAENPEIIFDSIKKNGIEKSDIITFETTRSEMPKYLLAADFALFFILPAYSKMASSPTKQAEMMDMQLPIICNDKVGDTADVIRNYKAGWVVENFSDEAYNDVIQKMISGEKIFPENIRKGAIEFYGLQNGIEKYWGAYKKILEINE
jgi:glycosyltransferase involved in cell wall biosynthesis